MPHWTRIAHALALFAGFAALAVLHAATDWHWFVVSAIGIPYYLLVGWVIESIRARDVRRAAAEPVDSRPGGLPPSARFLIVLRGYDLGHVHALVERVDMARGSDSPIFRAAVATEARDASFPIVMRGYDRGEVDAYLHAAAAELAT